MQGFYFWLLLGIRKCTHIYSISIVSNNQPILIFLTIRPHNAQSLTFWSILNFPRHYLIKLFIRNQPIHIQIRSFQHLHNLPKWHFLPNLSGHFLESVSANEPWVLVVEHFEHFAKVISRLCDSGLVSHQTHPFVERYDAVIVSVQVAYHTEDCVVFGIEAQRYHGLL